METDKRKWHVSKEIPVALIISMAGGLFLGGVAYQSLKSDVLAGSKATAELREEVKEVRLELRTLTGKFQESQVPSENAKWRIEQAERQASEVRAAVTSNSNAITDINRRLSIMELRNRAARER